MYKKSFPPMIFGALALASLGFSGAAMADDATAGSLYPECADAAKSRPVLSLTSLLGAHSVCSVTYEFYDDSKTSGTSDVPFPYSQIVTLDWDQVTFRMESTIPDAGFFQAEWSISADSPSPLTQAWFRANRASLFPEVTNWSAFDAAKPDEQGIIVFEFPDSGIYRGPIVDREASGAVLLIDVVGGNF